jgi:hypothetical protein
VLTTFCVSCCVAHAQAVRLVGEFLRRGAEPQQLADLARSHADRHTGASGGGAGNAGKQSQSAPAAGATAAAAASSSPAPVLMDDAKSPV